MFRKILNDRRSYTAALLFPSLAGVMIFVFIPFADSIRRSFCASGSGRFNGLKNYSVVFSNDAFRLAVRNTLLFTAVCLPLLISVSELVRIGNGSEFLSIILLVTRQNHAEMLSHFK